MRPYSTFTAAKNGLLLWQSTHDRDLNTAFKAAVPAGARKPHIAGDRFVGWLLDVRFAPAVADLSDQYLRARPRMPSQMQPPTLAGRVFRLEYLGGCKEQYDGNSAASGATGPKQWEFLFPELVLRQWFQVRPTSGPIEDEPAAPAPAPLTRTQTFYELVGVHETAADEDLKKAYRRAAFHTHPDHNREADAQQRFSALNDAYATLRDARMRKLYDLALAEERKLLAGRPAARPTPQPAVTPFANIFTAASAYGYRAPYRCGNLMVQGYEHIKFIVTKITAWEDITDDRGRTLVSYWPVEPLTGQPAPDYALEWIGGTP